jgi:hypothetical protein
MAHRGKRRVRAWLAAFVMAGCAKGTAATRESPPEPPPVAVTNGTAPGESDLQTPPPAVPGSMNAAPPARPDEPRFTLLVSNQSSALPQVDIQVRIDERLVVDDTFTLGSGHTVKRYELQLPRGAHELRATAHRGAATYAGSIEVQAELWGALLFWRSPKGAAASTEQAPAFTFQLQDSPIRFR